MRTVTLIALTILGGSARLAAQHGREYEFGMFGAYTRYDASFNLANKFGGGVRLGYLFGRMVGVEAEVLLQPNYLVGVSNAPIEPLIGSGSLVLNLLHGERNILYVLGGYSRLDFGAIAPYQFTDGGVHGAVGDKIFLGHHVALRLEARAIYTTDTKSSFSTKAVTHVIGSAGLAIFAPSSKHAPRAPAPAPPRPAPPAPSAPVVESLPPAPAPLPTAPAPALDSDQDGVPDTADACPNTPRGVTVDVHGCSLDTDHDGVPDGLDQCPNTPAGATVDASGCSIDSDHDGVPDGLDRCPDTPAGVAVDASGCAIDSDRDGVPDGIDRCPNTPAGVVVDATGCPVAQDSDGDGVPDTIDKCPNTPKGVPVDATGCMILFRPEATPPSRPGVPAPRPTLILRGVNFETGRSVLTTGSYAVLDLVAASLTANGEIRIEIAGYTDNIGPAGLNIRLSQARAAAVRAYLARKGVSPARMVIRGFGSAHPVASNNTPAGRTQNRRVELHKLP
jgi:outer membrane protein OmpA-like peptidoglycan-associated protein